MTLRISNITGVCSRLVGDILHLASRRHEEQQQQQKDSPQMQKQNKTTTTTTGHDHRHEDDEVMMRALTAVFGMANNGKINKVKARAVVENLGLVEGDGDEVDEEEGEVGVEEVLNDVYCSSLLREAFGIFDQDGNGYIEPDELKRVLHCLGLDRGSSWDTSDFNAMLKCVDLNSDGKVDFNEFQHMMMVPASSS